MDRFITVKGKGKASLPPDTIVLIFKLETVRNDYDGAMNVATEKSNNLLEALLPLGFKEGDLKTTSYEIDTEYESYRDKNNDYKNRFIGYRCDQGIRLEFSLDFKQLSKVLFAIQSTDVTPRLNIRFTIKDKSAVTNLLLKNATTDALKKAKILTQASRTTLGDLVSINYNWSEVEVYSNTNYRLMESQISYDEGPHIVPDDIEVEDTVTFVWEIQS